MVVDIGESEIGAVEDSGNLVPVASHTFMVAIIVNQRDLLQ